MGRRNPYVHEGASKQLAESIRLKHAPSVQSLPFHVSNVKRSDMAVDFSLLPAEEPFEHKPPSKLTWIMVFAAMVLLGVATILVIWPKTMTTHTWTFWASVLMFPVGIPTFVVFRRFSVYEARKLEVELRNEAARAFNEHVFRAASMPLALVGAAHRFSATAEDNAPGAIQKGTLALKTQVPIARDAEPVKARWLNIAGMRSTPGELTEEAERARQVTTWLFDELVTELSARIQALPPRVQLAVRLLVTNGLPPEANLKLWEERCANKSLRPMVVTSTTDAPDDLMALDRWMDAVLGKKEQHAVLMVAIQINPLLAASPLPGAAEAGVAVLLLPDALAHQHGVVRVASLHRPVRGLAERPQVPLSTALRWAGVSAERISGAWQTGLDETQGGALRETGVKAGVIVRATDLDQGVGHAGIAAPWLALACAFASLTEEASEQIVSVCRKGCIDCAVLRHASKAHSGLPTSRSWGN